MNGNLLSNFPLINHTGRKHPCDIHKSWLCGKKDRAINIFLLWIEPRVQSLMTHSSDLSSMEFYWSRFREISCPGYRSQQGWSYTDSERTEEMGIPCAQDPALGSEEIQRATWLYTASHLVLFMKSVESNE